MSARACLKYPSCRSTPLYSTRRSYIKNSRAKGGQQVSHVASVACGSLRARAAARASGLRPPALLRLILQLAAELSGRCEHQDHQRDRDGASEQHGPRAVPEVLQLRALPACLEGAGARPVAVHGVGQHQGCGPAHGQGAPRAAWVEHERQCEGGQDHGHLRPVHEGPLRGEPHLRLHPHGVAGPHRRARGHALGESGGPEGRTRPGAPLEDWAIP
mmetsp:Transcript_107648/g.291792  ORF Transcript_107648/g.291792 Transcript_107648/m.291792 type:complete len:216 (+) Transcript_107648:156-803(+)